MSTQKEQPHCPYCGSVDVYADANAMWNPETQEWEVCGVFDNKACGACEKEFKSADWRPIPRAKRKRSTSTTCSPITEGGPTP